MRYNIVEVKFILALFTYVHEKDFGQTRASVNCHRFEDSLIGRDPEEAANTRKPLCTSPILAGSSVDKALFLGDSVISRFLPKAGSRFLELVQTFTHQWYLAVSDDT